MKDVLFEITRDELDTGLRGFPIGYCSTSHVDPQKGLFYSGRPVADLAFRDPVEIIYLLYYGEMGTKEQIEKFSQDLKQRAPLNKEAARYIEALPREGRPMDLFAAAILIVGMFELSGDYKEDCLNLIAKIPEITARIINLHAGWGQTPPSNPALGYMENFVHMLQVPGGKSKEMTEVFRVMHVLSLDHGGGNLSTFVGKAVASGLENMYGSIAAAMTALAGARHGGANQETLNFVLDVLAEVGENATQIDVENLLKGKIENKEVIMGFGHAVLRIEDPRAAICYQYCQKHFAGNPLVKTAHLLRLAGSKVLKEHAKIADPYPNIDAITGVMLSAAGFPYPEYYTVLFGLARTVGIAIQIVDERVYARGGKGTPIVRPSYLYKHRT